MRSMTRPRKLAVALALALPLLAGGFALQAASSQPSQQLFTEVLRLINLRFVDTLSSDAVFEKAARGLVKELNDPYSELLTPRDFKQFTSRTGGRYAGLGMLIEDQQGSITVSKVYPNSPAERGGVREGDRIIQADTLSTRGWTLSQVSDYLVGTAGTQVTVKFARPGVGTPITLEFTRAIIHVPAVPVAISFDSIGYVQLQTFNENATDEVASALRTLTAKGVTGVILDLRGNPGGYLEQSISIANLFLRQGQEVLAVRGRALDQRQIAEKSPAFPSLPLVVLTDELSASASEIVAGALQDHDRAVVLGQTTFGKGLVQSVFTISGGYALKLTTAKWFTPSGRSIQRERKIVNGQFVEDVPDTNETEQSKRDRPAFRSDMGRVVYGGGGITPDLVIPDDTLTSAEQLFVRTIAPKSQDFYLVLYDYSLELSKSVKAGFTVDPAWRDEFYRRLVARNAGVDRKTFDDARRYLDRQLEQRITRFAFADSAARRRDLPYDAPLRRALAMAQGRRTQAEIFAQLGTAGTPPRR
jgi:carboxyl-terminal processing protease